MTSTKPKLPSFLDEFSAMRGRFEEVGKGPPGLTTGLTKLDGILGGGLQGLTILGGPQGVGKTQLALQIALSAASASSALVLSLEMQPRLMNAALVAQALGCEPRKIWSGRLMPSDWEAASTWFSDRVGHRLFVRHSPKVLDENWMPQNVAWVRRSAPDKPVLLVVDSLQNLAGQLFPRARSDKEAIDKTVVHLRQLVASDVVVLALSRNPKSGARNGFDFEGSVSIDYEADIALLLSITGAASAVRKQLALQVKKNRLGLGGQKIKLIHSTMTASFEEEAT